jgi:hypothetical protein
MDGLALLCNLFADGPVTLRRLRPHVRDLAMLEETPAEDLATWIQCSVPQARVFAEEAAILRHRIGEEATAPVAQTPPAAEPAPSFAGFGMRPVEEPLAVPAAREDASVQNPGAVRVATLPSESEQGDLGLTLLRAGLLPGLDALACSRLGDCGVRTVRALAEGAGLTLARRSEIPYSRLLGLARAARCFQRGEDPIVQREPTFEIQPFAARAPEPEPVQVAPAPDPEVPARTPFEGSDERAHDPFALPVVEPESAGPFG